MPTWPVVIALVAVIGCKDEDKNATGGSGSGSADQTYADAVRIFCGLGAKPPDASSRVGDWLDGQIRNPRARALLAALGDAPDRAEQVRRAAGDAGISGCTPLDVFSPRLGAGVDVPVLADAAGSEELDQENPLIVIDAKAITIDGKAVVAVDRGAIAAGDGAKLASFIAALREAQSFDRVSIAIDASLPVSLLMAAIGPIPANGVHGADVVVRVGGAFRAVLLSFPDPDENPTVGMLVALTRKDVIVASISGLEGKLSAPKLRVAIDPLPAAGTAVRGSLAEIVQRRGRAERRIVVTADGATTIATLAQMIAWIRPQFPEVVLGGGLE